MAEPTKTEPEPTKTTEPTKTDDKPADKPDAKVDDKPTDKPTDKKDDEPSTNLMGDDDEPTKPEPRAPEKYEDFTFPEGVVADPVLVDEAAALFKELDLPQSEAQKVIDFQAKLVAAEADKTREMGEAWAAELKADKTIGGDHLDANVQKVRQVIAQFDTDGELRGLLNAAGLVNNPPLFRFLLNVAGKMGEDTMTDSPGDGDTNKPNAEEARQAELDKMYPTMVKKTAEG